MVNSKDCMLVMCTQSKPHGSLLWTFSRAAFTHECLWNSWILKSSLSCPCFVCRCVCIRYVVCLTGWHWWLSPMARCAPATWHPDDTLSLSYPVCACVRACVRAETTNSHTSYVCAQNSEYIFRNKIFIEKQWCIKYRGKVRGVYLPTWK